jgi:3-oxoacyl-[acyl-carrier-protein] synthase-3
MGNLLSFGKYLPERIVTNEELAPRIGADPGWIEEMSGIRQRRWAAAGETLASMAAQAGRAALEKSNLAGTDLGAVIVASASAERRFPGPAAEVQFLLGASSALALDVPVASAGSLFALAQAELWLSRYENVLVIAAEKLSAAVLSEPIEKGTAMLFGDGAGAALLSRRGGIARIVDFVLASDGANAQELRLEHSGPVLMNGRVVIMHAARKVPAAIQALLQKNDLAPATISTFLMHQANANLIGKIAQTLGVDASLFYANISRYGNTSSASLLIAAEEWQAERGFRPGEPVVLAAFGAGFHWGAMLLEGT